MLKDEDIALFRSAIGDIRPLEQNVFVSSHRKNLQKHRRKEQREKENTLFFFSDEYEPVLDEDGIVRYLRAGEESYILKQLRRGDFFPELFLDLHGLTREKAKLELAALLQTCEKEQVYCASIMTGYGTYTLKRQIPRWLVQHPMVRALHQAPKLWGGEAAILVLLDV